MCRGMHLFSGKQIRFRIIVLTFSINIGEKLILIKLKHMHNKIKCCILRLQPKRDKILIHYLKLQQLM